MLPVIVIMAAVDLVTHELWQLLVVEIVGVSLLLRFRRRRSRVALAVERWREEMTVAG